LANFLFFQIKEDYQFGLHPYFGSLSKEKWIRLTKYHMNNNFKQFGLLNQLFCFNIITFNFYNL